MLIMVLMNFGDGEDDNDDTNDLNDGDYYCY